MQYTSIMIICKGIYFTTCILYCVAVALFSKNADSLIAKTTHLIVKSCWSLSPEKMGGAAMVARQMREQRSSENISNHGPSKTFKVRTRRRSILGFPTYEVNSESWERWREWETWERKIKNWVLNMSLKGHSDTHCDSLSSWQSQKWDGFFGQSMIKYLSQFKSPNTCII